MNEFRGSVAPMGGVVVKAPVVTMPAFEAVGFAA